VAEAMVMVPNTVPVDVTAGVSAQGVPGVIASTVSAKVTAAVEARADVPPSEVAAAVKTAADVPPAVRRRLARPGEREHEGDGQDVPQHGCASSFR
jgi:hypothetical protein